MFAMDAMLRRPPDHLKMPRPDAYDSQTNAVIQATGEFTTLKSAIAATWNSGTPVSVAVPVLESVMRSVAQLPAPNAQAALGRKGAEASK
jgi:hypothetical protein